MTPADELLAAADHLDALLAEATPGPWVYGIDHNPETCGWWIGAPADDGEGHPVLFHGGDDDRWSDAEYVAAMNPEVGRALVALLRVIANEAEVRPGVAVLFREDFALARAILAAKEGT